MIKVRVLLAGVVLIAGGVARVRRLEYDHEHHHAHRGGHPRGRTGGQHVHDGELQRKLTGGECAERERDQHSDRLIKFTNKAPESHNFTLQQGTSGKVIAATPTFTGRRRP